LRLGAAHGDHKRATLAFFTLNRDESCDAGLAGTKSPPQTCLTLCWLFCQFRRVRSENTMRAAHLALIAMAALFVATATPAGAAVLITVNKSTQRMTVEVDGVTRWTWPVSTGQIAHDTPSGKFTAFRMEADHFSKEWDDAPMPHSIFFTQKGHAIHGYLNTSRIGSPASHGCVRLAPDNAAKLYALVETQGLPNTKVVLTGDVRVALGQPRSRDPEASVTAGAPLETRPYGYSGYAPRYDDRQPQYEYRQSQYGYRPAPAYYPPRYPADYSYRPYPSGY
jgi:L,D-transpeptidase catalytic domain